MADTRLGPLKDPRSLDRGPALRGHGGWGRGRQEGDASNTATCASDTSTRGSSSSSWKWNPGFLADTGTAASSGGAGWGRPSAEVDAGHGGWVTTSVGGWPTLKSKTKGTGWTTPRDRDTDGDDDDGDDVTMDERSPSTRPGYRRLFAFNAKISQQPCTCLIKLFSRNEDTKSIQISRDGDYTVWEVEEAVSRSKNARFKFAGVFTNPVDGEAFIGGRSGGEWKWKGAEHALIEVPSIDGKTAMLPCYSSKANARHAAAARAVDCISFRTTDGEETYGMCVDQPYMDPAEAPSMPVAATAGTAGRNMSPPPKAQLQQYYQDRFLDFESIGKYFYSFDNGDDQHQLHTSVFINPTNGTERFGCGHYGGNGQSPSYKTTLEDADGSGASVEVVWYKRKKDAEHAAAARALDYIRLRESDPSIHPKLCSETPYLDIDEAPLLPLRFQLELETKLLEEPIQDVLNRRVMPLPMETEAEVALRHEYRMSRMP